MNILKLMFLSVISFILFIISLIVLFKYIILAVVGYLDVYWLIGSGISSYVFYKIFFNILR